MSGEMFDWNDQELKDVIWAEASESHDHIVPYPDGNEAKPPDLFGGHIKEERNREAANVKPSEQKKPVFRSYFNGSKQERNSQHDTNERHPTTGFSTASWPDLSLSSAARTDQDSMVTELSDDLVEVSEFDSSRGGEVARLERVSEVFPQQREESDFVDYGWANIGSFDDLDRIFSKDDQMFGQLSLCNADEIWSTSKNKTDSPQKSMDFPSLGLGALRSTSEHFEAKAEEYMLDQDKTLHTGYENMSDKSSRTPKLVDASMEQIGFSGVKSNLLVKDKMNGDRKLSKGRKKLEEKSKVRQLQDLCFTWSSSGKQLDSQYATNMGQPERKLQGPESMQYKHFSNNTQYPMPVLPQFFSSESTHQEVPSDYEIPHGNSNPFNNSPAVTMKPLTMTPQEKIEKLRRRQQMRALLAIQKQEQQFNHQDSCTEHFISRKCSRDNTQMTGVDENLSALPSLDPNTPIEQDDSSMVFEEVDYCSVEEAILLRLQDTIAKLDTQIRLCIRDSLFRLAQSAIQRKYASDTSSINKSHRDVEVMSKRDINSHNRFARVPDMETDTNSIDRIVAHLLFHRPAELSSVKLPETPVSTSLPLERKSMRLATGFCPESYCSSNQTYESHQQGLKSPRIVANESKTSPCLDASENASITEAADAGAMEVQVSQ